VSGVKLGGRESDLTIPECGLAINYVAGSDLQSVLDAADTVPLRLLERSTPRHLQRSATTTHLGVFIHQACCKRAGLVNGWPSYDLAGSSAKISLNGMLGGALVHGSQFGYRFDQNFYSDQGVTALSGLRMPQPCGKSLMMRARCGTTPHCFTSHHSEFVRPFSSP
jgi:hypothetical protein